MFRNPGDVERDALTPPRDIEAFARLLKSRGAGVQLEPFATDVHTGALRAAPARYQRAVDDFLDGAARS